MHQQANARPVREKVERGIYRRKTRDGKTTRYEIAYVDRDGRQRWETLGNLNDARRRRAELVSKPQAERTRPTKKLFAEVAEDWYLARCSSGRRPLRPRTARYYRDALDLVLLPRFGRSQLAAIDPDAIARLTRDLEQEGLHAIDPGRPVRPLGASSIENYLKPLQGIAGLAVRRRMILTNPFDLLTDDDRPVEKERRPTHEWTAAEVTALLDAAARLADRQGSRYDYAPLLRLAAALGLRLGEVLGLTWADFDKAAEEGAGVLHVRRQWLRTGVYGPPKTKSSVREIPLPAALRDELIAFRLRSASSLDGQPIFASRLGTPLQHRNVTRRGFEPARELAGLLPSLTFHDLRHAAASRLIAARLDPVTVAAVLGHRDAITTLRVYGHQFDRLRTSEAARAALAGERAGG
ncbi:MAG: site-specific integrase [Gaiellaceae bacterium]